MISIIAPPDASLIVQFYFLLLGWMPWYIQVLILGFLSVMLVYGLIKIVGMIMDALPFV